MTDVTLGIKITADGKIARAEVKGLSDDLGKLNSAGRNATTGISSTTRALKEQEQQLKATRSAITGQLIDPIKKVSPAMDAASRGMAQLGLSAAKLGGLLSGAAIVGFTKALVEIGDRSALLAARLQLVTNGARQFAAVQQQLYQQAQNVGISIESQGELYAKLARATEGTGRSAKDLLTITDVIAKNLKISGTSAAQAAGAMLQFGQAAGSGVVHAEEFNSMLEGMPTLVQGVARALGLTVSELKNLVNQGKITSAQWLDAMVQMREATDQQAAAMGSTFAQAMQRLGNSVFDATGKLNDFLGVSRAFASVANDIARGIDSITGKTPSVSQAIADVQQAALNLFNAQNKGTFLGATNTSEINNAKKALSDAVEELQKAQDAANKLGPTLAEGFGKAKYEIADVGKTADSTMQRIVEDAKKAGADVAASLAIAERESGMRQYEKDGSILFGRDAAGVKTSATGIFQIIKGTAAEIKKAHAELADLDAEKPLDNIRLGVTYVADLTKKFGDLRTAFAAFYVGEGKVQGMLDRFGKVDESYAPKNQPSIKQYVDGMMAAAEKWRSKYPDGLQLVDEKRTRSNVQAAKSELDSLVQTQLAAAKASETIKKSELAVQVAIHAEQRKAFEDYTKAQAAGMQGDQRVRYLEQAAQQEQAIIQQGVALKQRAINIERQATQAELAGINQRIAAADQLRLTESERVTLVNQQKQAQAELASLDQQYNVVAIQGAGELRDVLSGVADAYTQQAASAQEAADARQAIIDKLADEIAALEGVTAGHQELAAAEKASADLGKAAQEQYIKQVEAQIDKRDELKKAAADQQKAEKAVSDEVLRMGQYYQSMVNQARQMAQGLSQAFGETGAAIGNVVVGLTQYQDTMYNLQQRTEALLEANRKNGGGADKEMEIRAQAMNQELTYQIQNYGNLTQAAQSFFDKGTSGYQAMENATKVFRMVELALTLANYVQMATAGATYTAQDVAQSGKRATAKGIEAVAAQATVPVAGFAMAAAMAAMLAAMGVAIAGGTSSGAPRGAMSRSTKSEGTVFGDSSAQSDSIKNALELVAKNSTTDLAYSAGMLRSLQNIESAMAGVTNSIIRNVRPADVQGLGTRQTISWDPFAIFMKTTKAITDWGIGAFPQMLKDILSAGFQGKTFTDITTTTKLFGMTLASSTKTVLGDMASETEKQFTLVFRSITDTVREASRAFGTSADQFNTLLETFVVKFDTTSLKGLKGEELENAIQQQFSKIADQIAGALNIKGLDEFQRVGEGMFETLVRVSEGITRANAELDALGIKAIKYSEIQFKQGDTAAEIVRQSIVAFEGLESGVGKFIDGAVGSAEDLIATYQDLLASRDILKGLGLGWQDLNRTMTDAAGGVSAFRDALESFRDNFFSQGEQYATQVTTLAREFGNLGLILPQSKDEFRALAESIDTSTEAGAELFARVIKLSDAFSDAADSAEALEKKYQSYTNPMAGFVDQIDQVIDDWKAIMDYKLGAIEAEFANKASVAKKQINAPYQGSLDLTGSRKSTLESEIAQNVGFLNQTASEIGRLQDLINRWQGVPKAQAYVAGWRSQMEALQGQADVLVRDLQSKNTELADLNRKIEALNTQIAQNNADVDTAQLGDKLKALTDERRRLLREQGNAIVRTMREIWDDIIGVLDDVQRSIAGNIAKLQPGNAQESRLLRRDERQATGDLNRYINRGGNDPAKIASLVTAAQDAIMAAYEDQANRIINKYKRSPEYKEAVRDIRADAREKIQPIRAGLRADTRAVNNQLRSDVAAVQQDADARIKAIESSGAAAVSAYRAQVDGQIDAINAAMDAALQALEDRQQAEQDALQATHDARMQQLQDEHQAVVEALQEGKHYQQQQALDDKHFYEMRALSDVHDAQMRALADEHQAQMDAINDAHQAQMDALSDRQDARSDALSDAQSAASKAFSKQQEAAQKSLQKRLDKEMEAAQKQLDAAQEFANAIKSVADFAKSLSTSDLSPLSPEDQLRESKRIYDEMLAKARAGDAEAAGKYEAAAKDYLQKSEAYFGRDTQYAQRFAQVQSDATSLGATPVKTEDQIKQALDQLRESQEAQLDALRESQDQAAEKFQKGQEAQTRALQKSFEAEQRALQKALEAQTRAAQKAQEEQTRALQRTQEDESRALQKVQQEESRALQKAQQKELQALQRVQETESQALQKVFSDEMRALQRMQGGAADAIRDSYQKQIDAVNNSADDVIAGMEEQTRRQVEKIENQTQRQIDKLENIAQRQIDKLERVADRQINAANRQADRLITKLTTEGTAPALAELKRDTIAKLQDLDKILADTKAQARRQFNEQIDYLVSLNVINQAQLRQLNRIGGALSAGTEPVPGFAAGGYAKPGLAIVGEKGPELVSFTAPARVVSNSDSQSLLRGDDAKIAAAIAELKEQISLLTRAQVAANSRLVPAMEAVATETAAARRDAKIKK